MPAKRRDLQTEVEWRRAQLQQAGFPRSLAARVARDVRVDVHELIQLVEQGCERGLAVRILQTNAKSNPSDGPC